MGSRNKPTYKKISWAALVNKLDPNRKKKRVIYEFSGGKKFYGRTNYNR